MNKTKNNEEKIMISKNNKPTKQNINLKTFQELKKKHKQEIKKLHETIFNLEKNNIMLKFEIQKNIKDFQEKAKTFSSKAQVEVNKLKKELNKKIEEDRKEVKMYGSQKLLEDILEPINNIKIAIESSKNTNDPGINAYVQGFKMLIKQLFNELNDNGLKSIIPKKGDEFNPQEHEVISIIKGKNKDKIVEIKKIGFKLHNRVLKPAIVIIEK